MKARSEVGQAAWFLRSMGGLSNWTAQVRAIKRMTLPTLPRRRRTMGEVWGVSVVRDEKDVLEAAVKHLFDQGIAHVLIADNRSTDGTREHLLEWAAADARVHVALDEEPAYIQSQKMTWLAHCAWRAGADWIVPFDADEFRAPGIRQRLLRRVENLHHVPAHASRGQHVEPLGDLLHRIEEVADQDRAREPRQPLSPPRGRC